jgi:hypothetical protein
MSALAFIAPLVVVLIAPAAPGDRGPLVASRDPFTRGTLGLEFGGMLVTEAWNLNGPREWLAAGTAAVSWSFVNRAALLVEFEAVRVFQRTPRTAHVQGMATLVRWQVRSRDPWRLFVELGPGISWSDTTVPPRGTRFNYLILAGGGLLRRRRALVAPVEQLARRPLAQPRHRRRRRLRRPRDCLLV